MLPFQNYICFGVFVSNPLKVKHIEIIPVNIEQFQKQCFYDYNLLMLETFLLYIIIECCSCDIKTQKTLPMGIYNVFFELYEQNKVCGKLNTLL